ncbi:MAG: hypothetical protein RR740_00080 [Pseudomonas sp.]
MKIRILDPGFSKLTGLFGTVEFVNGVSAEPVSKAEAARLGTIISIEVVGTGENPSTTQLMVDTHNKNMQELGLVTATLIPASEAPAPVEVPVVETPVVDGAPVADPVKEPVVLDWSFTEDDLDAIVKKEGVAGLRTFAEPYDINDRSIAGLVQKLMDAKHLNAPVKQVEPEQEAPVETPVADEPTDEELDDLVIEGEDLGDLNDVKE